MDAQVSFPDVDPPTAYDHATALRDKILDRSSPESKVDVRIEREEADTLDPGTILAIGMHVFVPIAGHLIAEALFDYAKWRKTRMRLKVGFYTLDIHAGMSEDEIARIVSVLKGLDPSLPAGTEPAQ